MIEFLFVVEPVITISAIILANHVPQIVQLVSQVQTTVQLAWMEPFSTQVATLVILFQFAKVRTITIRRTTVAMNVLPTAQVAKSRQAIFYALLVLPLHGSTPLKDPAKEYLFAIQPTTTTQVTTPAMSALLIALSAP